jgi:hypothetical protein
MQELAMSTRRETVVPGEEGKEEVVGIRSSSLSGIYTLSHLSRQTQRGQEELLHTNTYHPRHTVVDAGEGGTQ